jgi:hypothetical protein
MRTEQETIELLDQLIEALHTLRGMWAEVEAWSEANLEPQHKQAA